MRNYSSCGLHFLFCLLWTEFLSASLVIRISSKTGNDTSSCRQSNATQACKSVVYALGALWDAKNYSETNFTFLMEDQVYPLKERVKINQTNALKSVYLKSSDRTVIRCEDESAGVEIGTREVQDFNANKTRNIYFQNLEFQNCGPLFAAVVLIWNSVDIGFTNCVFRQNKQAGINAFDSGVTIESCHFENNTSNGHNSSEKYKEGITSAGGAAGFLFYSAKKLSLIIRNSVFKSNAAVTNDSPSFVAPSYNVSLFITGGGGLLVAFKGEARHCQVNLDNSTFLNNKATFGGGVYFEQSHMAVRNNYTVTNSNFTGNFAGQTGGGLIFSQWDNASSVTTVFKNCNIIENNAKRGAGMNVFFMNNDNNDSTPNDSVIRLGSGFIEDH